MVEPIFEAMGCGMSDFGHGTFKQELLDRMRDVVAAAGDAKRITMSTLLTETLEVTAYFADELLRRVKDAIRDEVRREVRQELLEQLKEPGR